MIVPPRFEHRGVNGWNSTIAVDFSVLVWRHAAMRNDTAVRFRTKADGIAPLAGLPCEGA